MHYDVVQDPDLDFNERLRMEFGWKEVAEGLTKVIFGYGTLLLGTTLGFGMVLLSVTGLADGHPAGKVGKPSNFSLWMFYLGCGILSVIGLISYCMVIGGQFRCMMGAAERNGARWFMFTCCACLFFGPAFELASGIASFQLLQEIRKNPAAIRDLQLNPLSQWLHLIGFVISMIYPVCFVLFLRATAVCLRAEGHVTVISIFLVLIGALMVGTCFMLYQFPPGGKPAPPDLWLMLGGAWAVALLVYIILIFAIKACIHSVMANVKSPLEM
jgi:hypothetical protein